MNRRLAPGWWRIPLFIALIAGGYFYYQHMITSGAIPNRPVSAPVTMPKMDPKDNPLVRHDAPAPEQRVAVAPKADAPVVPVSQPMAGPANTSGRPLIRCEVMAWNSQIGWLLANGGSTTVRGSIMDKHGVNLEIVRQDDTNQMGKDIISFANAYASGNRNPGGFPCVAVMGDGTAAYAAAWNEQLTKLGSEYRAVTFASAGYSRGEDKFMAVPRVKQDPQNAKGLLIAGYLRDGDWNIALLWARMNGICNNPDETTYDPECINWMSANDFVDAGKKYLQSLEEHKGLCEDRPVVRNGKPTGTKQTVCVEGVVTWTPVDVTLVKEKGGLVTIMSTEDSPFQMPNAIIAPKKWVDDNHALLVEMVSAILEAGDIIKTNPAALDAAGEISARIYNEQSGAYWVKYYKGAEDVDRYGNRVRLGGSTVNNLADNLFLFGIVPGGTRPQQYPFKVTYELFGDIVKANYPSLVPSYPPVDTFVDTSVLEAVAAKARVEAKDQFPAEMPQFAPGPIRQQVAKRAIHINFKTGSAVIESTEADKLSELLQQLTVTGSLKVAIDGHTDNTGSPAKNQTLSEQRAQSVASWLRSNIPQLFTGDRVTVRGFGQTVPVSSNATPEGRADNRRVEITVGS